MSEAGWIVASIFIVRMGEKDQGVAGTSPRSSQEPVAQHGLTPSLSKWEAGKEREMSND